MAQRSSVVISDSAQVPGLPVNLSPIEKYNAELRVDRMATKQSRKSFLRAVEIAALDLLAIGVKEGRKWRKHCHAAAAILIWAAGPAFHHGGAGRRRTSSFRRGCSTIVGRGIPTQPARHTHCLRVRSRVEIV